MPRYWLQGSAQFCQFASVENHLRLDSEEHELKGITHRDSKRIKGIYILQCEVDV